MQNNELVFGLKSQLLSCLEMLKDCIDRCPIEEWNEAHSDYPFCQVVFHALFDCDLNLSNNEIELKNQEFHIENRKEFGNYEELDDKIKNSIYTNSFILKYYSHIINKVNSIFYVYENIDLFIPKSDYYKSMTQMERIINCIRHTQHHAAQLGLRLQLITKKEMEWIGKKH
jgi:hypothetical protein